VIFALAVDLRIGRLDERPMHADEGVNTFIFKNLYETGDFIYQRHDHHGPTLYYLTLPIVWLSGAESFADTSETAYRTVAVIFGLGAIALLWLLRDALGTAGMIAAALLMSLSPAMVYFSRYYIHEPVFVFFSLALIACGWRYIARPSAGWALAVGLSAGLMFATKETSAILFFALAVAAIITWKLTPSPSHPLIPSSFRTHLIIALLAALLTPAALFSAMFRHPGAIIEPVLAYLNYFDRAQGAGHEQPWWYYLKLLLYTHRPDLLTRAPVWSEALIVALALLGGVLAAAGRVSQNANLRFVRFIGVYTLCATLIFSLVPYKTPWNVLPFLQGMILLAGVGMAILIGRWRWWPMRAAAAAALVVATAHLHAQGQRVTERRYAASESTPYAYAHTTRDVYELLSRVERVATVVDETNGPLIIQVWYDDAWPLPWYLRHYTVGYGAAQSLHPRAGLIIAKIRNDGFESGGFTMEELETRLGEGWSRPSIFALRPRIWIALYTRQDLLDAVIAR